MGITLLFVGMISRGVIARVTLLSARSNGQAVSMGLHPQISLGLMAFVAVRMIAGATAFIVSFLIFDWWWPLIALVLGHAFIGPLLVSPDKWAFWRSQELPLNFITLGCSVVIVYLFLQ